MSFCTLPAESEKYNNNYYYIHVYCCFSVNAQSFFQYKTFLPMLVRVNGKCNIWRLFEENLKSGGAKRYIWSKILERGGKALPPKILNLDFKLSQN